MRTRADKLKEKTTQPTETVQKQSESASSSRVKDHRPKTATKRKLQELTNNNSRTRQLKATQKLMHNSPKTTHLQEIQEGAEDHADRKLTQFMKSGEAGTAPGPLQAKSETLQKKPETPQTASKENNTGLPDTLKSGIETLSGHSMDDVNVHYNSDKPAQLQAHAYTQGTDIHVGPGQEKHLPHEAWHAVQQKQGRVKPTVQMKDKVPVNDDEGLEKEADIMGAKALSIQKKENENAVSQSGKTASGTLQPVVQRKALDADIILKKIPEVLAGNSLLPEGEELKLDTELFEGMTLKARIEGIISTYEGQFQKDESPTAVKHNAQKVLTAFQTIGVVIARKLHMGGEGHKIAKALLASQKDRLIGELKTNTSKDESSNALSEEDAGDVMKTAEVLIGDDPVGMYVQDKTSLKKADASIRKMAAELGKQPIEVFKMLRRQFESRIGSLNLDQVKKGEVEAPEGYTFPLKDLYGEVSENFFKNLLDLDGDGKPKWGETGFIKNPDPKGWKDEARTFELNDINKLRDSVRAKKKDEEEFSIDSKVQKEKGWERLNKGQIEYLTGVEEEEDGQKGTAKERLINYFKEEKSKSQEEAEKAVSDGVENLKKWPITLTTKAQDMVKSDGEIVSTYKPFFSVFQEEKSIKDFLPNLQTDGTIKIVEDVLGRGLDYGQQRKEKDEQQIGFDSPLSLEDLPAMSCINYQYTTSKGPNYYGDTHFVLNPSVRGRAAFSYGTDCPERRDYYLLLGDILGKEPKTVDQICKGDYQAQDIEVHVYGNIDLKKDIIEFHLGNPDTLTDADLRGKKGVASAGSLPGSPLDKLKTLKRIVKPEDFEDLKKAWIKKQKGTEKLKELIKDLPKEIKSNIEALQETKTIDEEALSKAPGYEPPPPKTTTTTATTASTGSGGSGKKTGCYITTACVTARNLPDDCEELETLRYFRDTYMLNQPSGIDLVKFYYKQAPKIVETIDQDPESGTIYEELYQVIRKCVKAIQEKQNHEAFTTYVTMVLKLSDQYTPDMKVPQALMEASGTLHEVPAIAV